MRFWPFSRPAATAELDDDLLIAEDLLRRNVEDLMVVRERQIRGAAIVFGGELLVAPDRALRLMLDRFRPFGYTPFLRSENGRVWLQAVPLVQTSEPQRVGVNVALFVLTCLSTLAAGSVFAGVNPFAEPHRLLSGAPFAFTLLAILTTHEFGHYFTARYHRAAVSLPYFIPAPPIVIGPMVIPLFGTLGAVIRMRSIPANRNALFDIAAAGPIAGLLVAVPALVFGLHWSSVMPVLPGAMQLGDSLLLRVLVYLKFGTLPANMDVFLHPVALAGWFGLLVTALNLFPVGQLDGGRISYALFGSRHRLIGRCVLLGSVALGLVTRSANWFVWAAVVFLMVGVDHTPPLDDVTPLSRRRRVLAVACLLLLLLLIPPVPILPS